MVNEYGSTNAGESLPDFNGDVYRIAKEMGAHRGCEYEVAVPKVGELFLDVDSEDELKFVKEMVGMLQAYGVPITITRETPSKDPGHYHVVATMPGYVDPMQAIALQAILGSDRKREAYSYLRLTRGTGAVPVVCLFEKKREPPMTDAEFDALLD